MSDEVKPKEIKDVKEINNQLIVGIMIITMIISIGGTFLLVNKISTLQPRQVGYTGFAASDTGSAKIIIASTLSIEVDDPGLIDFGTCLPPSVTNTNASISSEMTEAALNGTIMNCSNTNIPRALNISNVGNIGANITVVTAKLGTTLLGGTSRGEFFYRTTNATTNGGCSLARTQATYNKFISTVASYKVCDNLTTTGGTLNKVYFWVNLTVPNDASTTAGAGGDTATLTFSGTQA